MDALTEAIVEWIAGERGGQHRAVTLAEITKMASHNKLWPAATVVEWQSAIDRAVASGAIVEKPGGVLITAPVVKEKKLGGQMRLFNEHKNE